MTQIPLELAEQLPPEIDPETVTDHVAVGHAPGGGYGETHLLSHHGHLLVFFRGSMLAAYEQLELSATGRIRLERGSFESVLYVPTRQGEQRIVLSMFEVDAASVLVGGIYPDAVPHDPDAPPTSPPPVPKPKPKQQKRAAQPAKRKPAPAPPRRPPAVRPQPPPPPPPKKDPDPRYEIERFEALLHEQPGDIVASLYLEERYREQGDYGNLARILLDRVEHLDSTVEQVETLHEVAEIYASSDDAKGALELLEQAYLLDYHNRSTVRQLQEVAEAHDLWNKLLTDLNDEVQKLDEIAARAGILVQMSRWYRKIYSRSDYADACLMHAKRLDPQHPDVLAALAEPA